MRRSFSRLTLLAVLLLGWAWSAAGAGTPELIARSGRGALYELEGQRVAILAGSAEEMGRQHGELLKDDVHAMINTVLSVARAADNVKTGNFFAGSIEGAYARCKRFIPGRFLREIDALADAAGVPRKDARLANIFPELFHCSGFAVSGKATVGGELLHGRVLDYMTQIGLQAHAVTFVCVPERGRAFVNVGYAGFIGSVTGMNDRQVAFGEMGGRGEGKWDGTPMGFLMRRGLEEADTLADALKIFRETPRTCEYYYVISDGKTRTGAGLYCTPEVFETVAPGQLHAKLPTPVDDTVLFSAGGRYKELVRRVKGGYGRIDAAAARDLMTRPVAMASNLHCVLFAPERRVLWVAQAVDPEKVREFQACNQPYIRLDMADWLKRAAALKATDGARARRTETEIPDAPDVLSGTAHDNARPAIAPDEGGELGELLAAYRLPPREFSWSGKRIANTRNFAMYDIAFPSPIETRFPQNNTVRCEYYRAHGSGPRPAVVVLHILDGRFVVARLTCTALANSGVDALMLKLPFYGERRPPDIKAPMKDPELFTLLIQQGVADVRRASALLAGLERTPKERVGVTGVSLGGFVAALTAGVDGNYRRAAFVLAGGDLYSVVTTGSAETAKVRDRFAKAGYTGDALKAHLRVLDPLTFASRLKPCEVMMLNVTGDEVVPRASAEALALAAGGKRIIWYEGPEHTSLATHVFSVLMRTTGHFGAGQDW